MSDVSDLGIRFHKGKYRRDCKDCGDEMMFDKFSQAQRVDLCLACSGDVGKGMGKDLFDFASKPLD